MFFNKKRIDINYFALKRAVKNFFEKICLPLNFFVTLKRADCLVVLKRTDD